MTVALRGYGHLNVSGWKSVGGERERGSSEMREKERVMFPVWIKMKLMVSLVHGGS